MTTESSEQSGRSDRPLHCEGCGMKSVVYADTITGTAGGPCIYLCTVCSSLGGAFVHAVKDGEQRQTSLLLLKIHAKLSRIYETRWDNE